MVAPPQRDRRLKRAAALGRDLLGERRRPSLAHRRATAAGGMLVMLNAGFYSFLTRRRGLVFAIRAMPLQWLYYLYGSAVFAATWIESRLPTRARRLA